jgi:hypothetical protein
MTTNFDPHLNDSDLDLLSAYIDRRLSAEERAALERRLDREPALRGQLDELSATVALLRDLEPARPPRSFALDPAVVAPRRAWSFPWRGLGSAVVALFLLVAFGAALLRVGGGVGAPTAGSSALRTNQEAAAATPAPEVGAAGGAAAGAPAAGAAATSAAAAPAAPMAASAAQPTSLPAEQPNTVPAAEPPAIAAAKEPTPAPQAQQPGVASVPEQVTIAPESTSAFGAAGESNPAATATPQLAAAQPAPQATPALATAAAAADAQANTEGQAPAQPAGPSAAGGSAASAPTAAGYTAQAIPSTSAAEQPQAPNGQEGISGSQFGLIVGAVSLALLVLIAVLAIRQRRQR